MPVYGGIFLFSVFASAGLPGLSGFVGEFTILMGSYLTLPVLAIAAGLGVILAAVYLLWAYERMWMGPVNPKIERLLDLDFREIALMVPLIVLIIGLGVYPKPVMERIQPSVEPIIERIEVATGYEAPQFGRITDLDTQNAATESSHDGGGG